jgi:hypothetical protein
MEHVVLDTEQSLMETLVEAFAEGHARREQQSVSTVT